MEVFFPTEEGTPQGGIISPTLANMTLDGLQSLVQKAVKPYWQPNANGRKWIKPKINLVRYADDFIVTAKDKETIETVLLPLIREFMAERGLMLSEEKTKITHISEGFDFLGFNIREYKSNGKLLTKPSKDAMKQFCDKVRTKIKSNKSAKASSLIRMLNHMIPDGQTITVTGHHQKHSHVWTTRCTRRFGNGQNAGIRKRVCTGLKTGISSNCMDVSGVSPL